MTVSELVKPLQTRRGRGWSVVYREDGARWQTRGDVFVKTQCDYSSRVLWRGYRLTPTLRTEFRALKFCKAHGISTPEVVCFRSDGGVTELVLQSVEDPVTIDVYLQQTRNESESTRVIQSLAGQIARLHALNWVHGALGNDHILIDKHGKVVLIDFEKSYWSPLRIKRDLQRFWKRTGCFSQRQRNTIEATYQHSLLHPFDISSSSRIPRT